MSVLAVKDNRDLIFDSNDFQRVRAHIYQRAGIALAENKTEMVYSRLAKRVRALGKRRFADYLALLEADSSHPEWEEFTNSLTTNLTSFFREAYHFPLLAKHARERGRPLSVWCCAASTGEEPYSIAITLAEATGGRVLATDIDTRALATAERGIYPLSAVDRLGTERLRRFFLKGAGSRTGFARVHGSLREMVEFRPLNLLERNWGVSSGFDVVFCRNLMIYFDQKTQRALLDRFAAVLKPDGLLFAGHSENFSTLSTAFRLRDHTVYERVVSARSAS